MAEEAPGITLISVAGFKSIERGSIEIRPLTILAGANSSGKSSIMQPMLLMKQTLEATYDPGPLLLKGPHVQFTENEQLLTRNGDDCQNILTVGLRVGNEWEIVNDFKFPEKREGGYRQIELSRMVVRSDKVENSVVSFDMGEDEVYNFFSDYFDFQALRINPENVKTSERNKKVETNVVQSRCFLHFDIFLEEIENNTPSLTIEPAKRIQDSIEKTIHVPGLRGNPQRAYPFTPVEGPRFQGPFQPYTASLIWRWQEVEDSRLKVIRENLTRLGLTKWVKAERIDDVSVNLKVGRLPVISGVASEKDTVDIADVGFGVSQVLPVLVALAVAEPDQMVYIEQPELHLHPRAQVALAEVLADAAKRGVRVVVETHSPLLLQGIMTLIAEDKLESDNVMLHWFQRDEEGKTEITSVEPDENGAYGDWPEDFMEAEMAIQGRYLDAVAERELAV